VTCECRTDNGRPVQVVGKEGCQSSRFMGRTPAHIVSNRRFGRHYCRTSRLLSADVRRLRPRHGSYLLRNSEASANEQLPSPNANGHGEETRGVIG
jgi:hypothetical protein